MSENRLSSAAYGNMSGTVTDYTVAAQTTDGATGNGETEYLNSRWAQQFGYYKKIPELRAAIDAKARWAVGKGYTSNGLTQLALMDINGIRKDTFNTILENGIRTYQIGGDSFTEIIRDKAGKLINLKPLDPGTIKIIANDKGLIIRYEQVSKVKSGGSTAAGSVKLFRPEQMFHLCHNRTADEIHGISLIDAVEEIILMRNECMADMRQLMHRHVKPVIKWRLDTDKESEIAAFKAKADYVTEHGENIFIPMGTAEADILSVPANATLNPLPWIDRLNQYFFQAAGVPQIIVGGSQEMTEATAKIAYLAFEQTINEEQLYIEEQVLSQLNLEIELEFPATLQNEMLSDQSKSETMQAATPEDTTLTNGGVA